MSKPIRLNNLLAKNLNAFQRNDKQELYNETCSMNDINIEESNGDIGRSIHILDGNDITEIDILGSSSKELAHGGFENEIQDQLSLIDPYYDLTSNHLEKLFKLFDYDDDKRVSYDEFRRGLNALGIECTDDPVFNAFINKIDVDNSGDITYDEFAHAVQTIKLAHLFDPVTIRQLKQKDIDNEIGVINLNLIDYSPDRIRIIHKIKEIENFMYSKKPDWARIRWVNIQGKDIINLRRLAIKYRLHPLAVEDTIDWQRERPKFESYDDNHFLVVSMIRPKNKAKLMPYLKMYQSSFFRDQPISIFTATPSKHQNMKKKYFFRSNIEKPNDQISIEEKANLLEKQIEDLMTIMQPPKQLSIYILKDTILSIEEEEGSDLWENTYNRLKPSYSKVRQNDAPFLVYTILDILVDEISPIVNGYGAYLLLLEKLLSLKLSKFNVKHLHVVKNQLIALQRTLKPMAEVISKLFDSDIFLNESSMYLNDVLDHMNQMIDLCESHIETCRYLIEEWNTFRSNRQNDIMFVLSLVATLFIPAQFLTGLYGMNFSNMPELQYKYGYLIWWIVTISLALLSLYIFKRKNWL